MKSLETIAAIATAYGESGIGIVRICGEDAVEIVDKIFSGRGKLGEQKSHTIHYGHIYRGKEVVDQVLVMLMRAPRTYTGEDTVEINCHGGRMVLEAVLETVLGAGARLAAPGEFTKRAFLNGKLDLSQAEAVIDVIEAKNRLALQAGIKQLEGGIKEEIQSLRSRILEEMAYIEAALDDPEHYSLEGFSSLLKGKIMEALEKVEALQKSYRQGLILKEGVNTVILGRPNAGKSSLLNLLTGKERAIVTDIAGTTRDTLTEEIRMAGIHFRLTDTAGLRQTRDLVESIGVERAVKAGEEADLVLFVLDGTAPLSPEDVEILKTLDKRRTVILMNKSDRPMFITREEVAEYASHVLIFSAKEGQGLEELENILKEMYDTGELAWNDQVIITSQRHADLLEESRSSLVLVLEGIAKGLEEDFLSIDLMNAYTHLGEILGEQVGDDVVNEIFAKFCMGK